MTTWAEAKRDEGRAEGRFIALRSLLLLKFGSVDRELAAGIRAVTPEFVDRYVELLLSEPAGTALVTRESFELLMRTLDEEFRAKGRAEGRAEILRKLLVLRFGAIDPAHEARIEAAALESLDGYLERVLTATTLDAVFS